MGKPFQQEINALNTTFTESLTLPIDNELLSSLNPHYFKKVFFVGSGGSYSAAEIFCLCHNISGGIAKSVTPLELFDYRNDLIDSTVVLISASGKNHDILFAAKLAMKAQSKKIIGITLNQQNKLSKLLLNYTYSIHNPLRISFNKDGFLSVNSLLAYFIIALRIYANWCPYKYSFSKILFPHEWEKQLHTIHQVDFSNIDTILLVYSPIIKPVAIDFESKLSEAGIYTAQICDFRNFAHGRHNWLDKRGDRTVVIGLSTYSDSDLALKTFRFIPDNIQKVNICSNKSTLDINLQFLVLLFHIVNFLGKTRNIDPGRPGVPSYGTKIYNLNFEKLLLNKLNCESSPDRDFKSEVAIANKLNIGDVNTLSLEKWTEWLSYYKKYKNKITSAKYSAIIFDYDQTLCSSQRKYIGPDKNTSEFLNSILSHNIIVGVATGRGKSVHAHLRKCINPSYWNRVIIGFYNGGHISALDSEILPNKKANVNESLISIHGKLKLLAREFPSLEFELRPTQLSIFNFKIERGIEDSIIEIISQFENIYMMISSHSMDIFPKKYSKNNLVQYIKNSGIGYNTLCIGDKGKFPGNDYYLLDNEYSLSTDEVSLNPNRCWYFGDGKKKGVDGTLFYLNRIRLYESFFKIKL